MGWLNKLLGQSSDVTDVPSQTNGYDGLQSQPEPLSLAQHDLRAARELVQECAVRTAREFGIPAHWLSFEVVSLANEVKAVFQLQVTLQVWDEQLWAQASAFEQQVAKRLSQENVLVARALRAVLWRISPNAGCPHDELAPAPAWRPEVVKVRNAEFQRLRTELPPTVLLGQLPILAEPDVQSDALAPPKSFKEDFHDTYPVAGHDDARSEPSAHVGAR